MASRSSGESSLRDSSGDPPLDFPSLDFPSLGSVGVPSVGFVGALLIFPPIPSTGSPSTGSPPFVGGVIFPSSGNCFKQKSQSSLI